MKPTTAQQRMDLLKEIADAAHGTITEWCRRWNAEGDGEEIRLRHHDDGTAVVEVDADETMRVLIAVDVSLVDFVDVVNKPTGFVLTRTWSTVPAGWFVQAPKNAWYEVIASRREGDQQMVTLNVGNQQGTWPRDPNAEVKVRRGTLVDKTMDAAMDALGSSASIINDTPPFDPPYVRS